ncbi:MAG: transposase [Myxococcota bacterium]
MTTPSRLYFVTNRTFQSRLLLTPSPYVNNLVGGVIARALKRYDVALHAFVFLSNHCHLIVSSATGAVSEFMGYVEANIAKEVGRHIGWRGKLWHRRFSAEPILDDEALERRLAYIFGHGVKEGLVERASDWPGLNCIPELCHNQRRLFPWFDRTAQYWARLRGGKCDEALFATWDPLVLTPPPAWQTLTAEQRAERARHILEQAELQAVEARGDKPPLGGAAVVAQDPHAVPSTTKRSPRPLCHASSRSARDAFRALYREFVAAYREASALFRAGRIDAEFPDHCYKPPLPRSWCLASPPLAAVAL